ncbi:hypothetical protein N7466_002926 [Penicillium verhagenii]|uniref:uncharacterized protein n=1 Tax=Penicillium verhagenii TaxID=1562060 RepID=UPI00254587A5|nr:uncharacterized protein N7466_002926 [Penicillium verhagenii]KAJ5939792.1 hypothetical protein N7466_002926 [Penicillium verhagenii]
MPEANGLPILVMPPEPPIPPPTGNWAHVQFDWDLHFGLTDMDLLTQARIYITEDDSRWPAGMANCLRKGWMDDKVHASIDKMEEGNPILSWHVEGEFVDIRHQYLQAESILVQWQRDVDLGRGLPFDRSRLFRFPWSRWNYVIVF